MKRLLFLTCLLVADAHAQQPAATTVEVGLFTTHAIHSLSVTPIGTTAWMQSCASCEHTRLHGPVSFEHIAHPVRLGGDFRIQPGGDISPIEASGLYKISETPRGLSVTVQLPSERYVAAVLSGEAAPDEPAASLEALAITARTFALTNLHRHKASGFDLCDSTHCQALHLGPVRPAVEQAVRNTAGITLWSGSRRASVYYTQHCGGISEVVSALWPVEHAAYLVSHPDPYCLRRSAASWQTSVSLADLAQIASEQHWNLPTPMLNVRVAQHTESGRAKTIEISNSTNTAKISASSLRFAINRSLGWNRIRSDLYKVSIANGMLRFAGHGYGHGIGLCQAGAFQMAVEHHTAAEILNFYFPTARSGFNLNGEVWQDKVVAGVTIRSITPDVELQKAVRLGWQQALSLLPTSKEPIHPGITVAPTTELFRQLTNSPGYLLAVTRGNQITLQPLSTLRRYGPVGPLLLHEFLHALIESEATDKAPLWLREGLAEALAGSHSPDAPPGSSIADVEHILKDSQSLSAQQQAHRDAAAYVRELGHTYSLAVMRRWLRDGVPSAVLATLHHA